MHIEYFACLSQALEQYSEWQSKEGICPGLRLQHSPFLSFEVTDCKEDHGFLLTSNLAFKLKRAFWGQDSQTSALHIAEGIVATLRQAEGEYFAVQAGGLGFINANPKREFLVEFYRRLVDTKGACLFHEQSLVVFSQPSLSNPDITFSWPLSWEKILKGKACQDLDTLNFVDLLSKKTEISFDEQLMLLALVACPELEAKPFLLGLKGRQNIPWYLEEMKADINNCQSALSQEKNSQQFGLIKEFFDGSYLNIVLNQLLLFRNRLFHWRRSGHPGLLVALLLRIAQDFYAFYHLPQTRNLFALFRSSRLPVRSAAEDEYRAHLAQVLEILQHVTNHVLVLLQCACMRGELALQLQQGMIMRKA